MKSKGFKIDVHHHCLPEAYLKRLESIGIKEALGNPFPEWSPEKSLSVMDKLGIRTAILSISSPGVYFKDDNFSKDLVRLCNENMAGFKIKYSGRFGAFASVPPPHVEWAEEELTYAIDELKLDGVCLLTHYEGRYLGDKAFDSFFNVLNRRKMVVFIHPTDPIGQYNPKLNLANSLIEAPFETTRAVTNLIFSGTADRYKDISYILPHGGGTIPYLAWRIALVSYGNKEIRPSLVRMIYDFAIKKSPETVLKILKNMYYDTAIASNSYSLRGMHEFVGEKKIVFGTDFPFTEKVVSLLLNDLKRYDGFSKEGLEAIEYNNCLDLFPQFINN